jgi:exopolyphosphatase / guanosine-5'-triphosphate,3'-diphosphate pyrophosphatase
MHPKELFASIDLGSNSFRLEIGRLEDGHLRRVEYLKEVVRQGNGLDADRNLTQDAMQRGWTCLARFGERLAGFRRDNVRAVATQTLREARNRDEFLSEARRLLGFPIEVITGKEEARLIYLGVAHHLPQSQERRLVIDIGGRSTELILGQAYQATTLESYRLGSVAWSMKYFPEGLWTSGAFKRAEVAAKAILDEVVNAYPREAWDQAYGSSGTIGAVAEILVALGRSQGEVTPENLTWLRDHLISIHKPEKATIGGLSEDRKPVIGGGLAVLRALMELLQIDRLYASDGALRQGALYDLIDRDNPEADVRSGMVRWLAKRFPVDTHQAQRVSACAQHFLNQIYTQGLPEDLEHQMRKLGWASSLHEIGMHISHSDYHKHGAYILQSTDMPGFTVDELRRLAFLVLGHRGKLRKLETELAEEKLALQLMALRLALIFCHARRDPQVTDVSLRYVFKDKRAVLSLPNGLENHYPQTLHLIREEIKAWAKTGYQFEVVLGDEKLKPEEA